MSSSLQDTRVYEVYRRLPIKTGQIRIASLLPSVDAFAPLRVQLESAELDSGPTYEALSYVWGVEQGTKPLTICLRQDGHACTKQPQTPSIGTSISCSTISHVSMTQNLEIALRHLRLKLDPRRLWIDAICIDQTNTRERNQQVQQMRRIYSEAPQVTVWLGEASPDSELVFDIFDNLRERFTTHQDVQSVSNSVFQAVDKFFARPWWSRRWVTQEVLLAKKDPYVMCGYRSALFENVVSLIRHYSYVFDWGLVITFRMDLHNERQMNAKTAKGEALNSDLTWVDRDLIELYAESARQDATDLRDHVYALLGMTTVWYRENIKVNYDLSTAQVYQQATFAAIKQSKPFKVLLGLERTGLSAVPEIPSWCKDFSTTYKGTSTLRTPGCVRRITEWSINTSLSLQSGESSDCVHNIDLGILSVRGVILGEVRNVLLTTTKKQDLLFRTKVSHLIEAFDTFHTRLGVTAQRVARLLLPANKIYTGLDKRDASHSKLTYRDLCYMLTAGNTSYSAHDIPYDFNLIADILFKDTDIDNIGLAIDGHERRSDRIANLTTLEQEMLLAYLKDAVLCAYWESSYFQCTPVVQPEDGSTIERCNYIGITSRTVLPDDVVAMLHGCDLPAILRPTQHPKKSERSCWSLVSFAYVTAGCGQGLMDGVQAGDTVLDLI